MQTGKKVGLLALALAVFVAGCDSDEDIVVELETYAANLTTLNPQLGTVTGTAKVEIVGDQMRVTVNAVGLDSIMHVQFIGSGGSCPTTASADTNLDGLVDFGEGMAAYGQILLSLDDELAVRPDDFLIFPAGTTIAYVATSRLSDVENSLRGGPTNTVITNIPIDGDFNPAGKAVVILGDTNPAAVNLPTIPDRTPAESVPVACGVLSQVF